MNSDDPFEFAAKSKKERHPLSFNQVAFAVMLGTLCAQEIRGIVAVILASLSR